jgi:hypothetical protein
MAEVKGQDGRQLDRKRDERARASEHRQPLPFDALLLELDELLEDIVGKALIFSKDTNVPSFPHVVIRVAQELTRHWQEDVESGSARASMHGESAARIESAWRRAMIEAQGWAPRVSSSVDEEKEVAGVPATEPVVDLSNITLSDEIQRLLRSRVESGQFPSQEALIEAALRSFLIEEPAQEVPGKGQAAEPQPKRVPSPFILDEWVFGPGDIPRRPGREVDCVFLRGEKRRPDRYPGE